MTITRRPVEDWMLPASLCGDRVAHPPHEWGSDHWADEDERFWCRGRIPFTLESAADGMARVETVRQAEGWREMCERTPSGRAFLCTPAWRRLYRELQAAEEQARVERQAPPLWLRLWRRWRCR